MKALFTVAIVGRPNVGKSSLFNCLLGYRRAIVLDLPGTTMDEVGEKADWGKGSFRLVDSQGIFSEKDKAVLESLVSKADAFVFVVDAISGVTPFDRWIANQVRRAQKPTLLVANKTEGKNTYSEHDFSDLGFRDTIGVSAAHRRNIQEIKDWCLLQQSGNGALETVEVNPEEDIPDIVMMNELQGEYENAEAATEELSPEVEGGEKSEKPAAADDAPLTLALVGRPNTGKSTLMNRLCDSTVSRVSPIAHTTRDPISYELKTAQGEVKLVDTAGMRRPRSQKDLVEVFSIHASTRTIRNADVVFLLINAAEPITDQDMRLLNLLEREGKPAAVILNFWDKLSSAERKHFLENTEFAPYIKRFRTIQLSGLTGWNVERCLPTAFRLFKQSHRRVKTSRLNRMVENILLRNPPPTAGKQNFNILYASQVRVDPPTFVFFMNRKGNLPLSYQRYIENRLQRDLGFKGQTLRVYFRGERDSQ